MNARLVGKFTHTDLHNLPTGHVEAGFYSVISGTALQTSSIERLAAKYITPMPSACLPKASRRAGTRTRGYRSPCCSHRGHVQCAWEG